MSTIGTANPTRSESAPTTPVSTDAEQRADVVELVEAADDHVHADLAVVRAEAVAAGDPGRRGERQRRDHRDAGA